MSNLILWILLWIFACVFPWTSRALDVHGLSKDFCLLQPEKHWLVPTIQMKISKDINTRHPAKVYKNKAIRAHHLEISYYVNFLGCLGSNRFQLNKGLASMAIEIIKIMGAVLQLPAKQLCHSSPFSLKNGPNGLNWQCCLAGSSKTAPRILIFSIAMGAKPSF